MPVTSTTRTEGPDPAIGRERDRRSQARTKLVQTLEFFAEPLPPELAAGTTQRLDQHRARRIGRDHGLDVGGRALVAFKEP